MLIGQTVSKVSTPAIYFTQFGCVAGWNVFQNLVCLDQKMNYDKHKADSSPWSIVPFIALTLGK